MRHQLFEDWLFAEEDLDSQQKDLLESHKQDCQQCQMLEGAWQEISQDINSQNWVMPEEGFSQRWLSRLEQQKLHDQRRHAFWAFLTTSSGAVLFGILLLRFFISNSPIVVLSYQFHSIMVIFETLQGLIRFLLTIIRSVNMIIPSVIGLGVIFMLWSCLFLGLVVIWQVVMGRRELYDY